MLAFSTPPEPVSDSLDEYAELLESAKSLDSQLEVLNALLDLAPLGLAAYREASVIFSNRQFRKLTAGLSLKEAKIRGLVVEIDGPPGFTCIAQKRL